MKIAAGSMNPAKIAAVKEVFPADEVIGYEATSNVSAQPFSDEETREGAINRALECLKVDGAAMGIGLEGGVMVVENQLYLCNWGALVDKQHNIFTASGAKIALPQEVAEQLNKGYELGDVMDMYTKKENVRKKEGAIGIFTNELVTRKEMFVHVMKLLRGQWEFKQMKKENSTEE